MRPFRLPRAWSTRPGYDWFYPYYRDRALCLTLGMTPHEMLLQAVGAAADPASGGRQMPAHWSDRLSTLSPVRPPRERSIVQAVGCAEGLRRLHPGEDRLVLACSGEGATSEGEFWESINQSPAFIGAGSVPDSGQRLGHFGSGGKPDAGRIDFEAGQRLSGSAGTRSRRHGFHLVVPRYEDGGGIVPRRGMVQRWCTRTASGPIPIRSATTNASIRRSTSAKKKHCAIRSPPSRVFSWRTGSRLQDD